MYTQVMYCLERVPALVAKKPELANVEPFKTVLSGNHEAIAKLTMPDLEKILAATLTGMTVERVQRRSRRSGSHGETSALEAAVHRAHVSADAGADADTCAPTVQDVHRHRRRTGLRARVREQVYGIPPEQVVGTAGATKYGYDKHGQPMLTKEPKLLLNDNDAGKAGGNSPHDRPAAVRRVRQFDGRSSRCSSTRRAGDGARLAMLVLHDDATREYAYGPAKGLPDTQGRRVHSGAVRRSEEERLGRDQHEERLEAHLRVRAVTVYLSLSLSAAGAAGAAAG